MEEKEIISSEKFQPKPYQRKPSIMNNNKPLTIHPDLLNTNPYKTNPTLTQSYNDVIIKNKQEKELEGVKQKLEKAKKTNTKIRKSSKELAVKIGSKVGRGISQEELKKSLKEHLNHIKGRMKK